MRVPNKSLGQWKVVVWRVSTLTFAVCIASLCAAQDAWQAMRIYVPEEQVDSIVPKDYVAIEIKDLEPLLEAEANRRKQSNLEPEGIERATYVARLDGQNIRSKLSRWEIRKEQSSKLVLDEPSFAIEPPPDELASDQNLLRFLRLARDNQLQLQPRRVDGPLWFGFSARCDVLAPDEFVWKLQLPRAALADLLLAIPDESSLTGDVPIQRVDEISSYLGENWPLDVKELLPAQYSWYQVSLGGRSTAELRLTYSPKLRPQGFRTIVQGTEYEYQLSPSGLRLDTKIRLDEHRGDSLRLRISESLRVRAIRVNNVDIPRWQVLDEVQDTIGASSIGQVSSGSGSNPKSVGSHRSTLLEVPLNGSAVSATNGGGLVGPTYTIAVEAIAPLPALQTAELPVISVDRGFVLDGRGWLKAEESIVLEDVVTDTERISTTESVAIPGTSSWHWQWSGRSPQVVVRVSSSTKPASMQSFTRLSVQSNTVAATSRIRLTLADSRSNQIELKVGADWFIDSVSLEQMLPGFSYEVIAASEQENRLRLRWDGASRAIDMNLLVNAHQAAQEEQSVWTVASPRVLEIASQEQQDVVAIESVGRYQLRVTPELLRLRIREEDLLPWQKDALPRLSDTWLFRSTVAAIPSFSLVPVRATVSVKFRTELRLEQGEWVARYLAECQPLSGSIDEVGLLLPIPEDAKAPTWELEGVDGSVEESGVGITTSATSTSSGETTFQVAFTKPLSRPFRLMTVLPLSAAEGKIRLPLVSSPQSITQDALLVYPSTVVLESSAKGVETLSSARCCGLEKWSSTAIRPSESTGLRYDPNLVDRLQFDLANDASSSAWASSVRHDHWLVASGRQLHQSDWSVTALEPQIAFIHLPEGWEVTRLTIRGIELAVTEFADRSQLAIQLPAGSSQIIMTCSSEAEPQLRMAKTVPSPAMSIATLKRQDIVWIPEVNVVLGSVDLAFGNWTDRFWVTPWWRWLGFQQKQTRVSASDSLASSGDALSNSSQSAYESEFMPKGHSYYSYPVYVEDEGLSESSDPALPEIRLWIVPQSTAYTLAIALVLIATALAWGLTQFHVWRWTLLLGIHACLLASLPVAVVPILQIIGLGLGVALALQLACYCIEHARPIRKRSDAATTSGLAIPRSTATVAAMMMFAWSGATHAQSNLAMPSPQQASQNGEIFGILIPIDDKNELAGEYVYVPTKLSRLLSNPKAKTQETHEAMLSSASYSLRISADSIGQANTLSEITAEYRVDSDQPDSELRFPFSPSAVEVLRLFVDGQEIVLSSRMRQGANGLTVRIADPGQHVLRFLLKPADVRSGEARSSFSIPVPPLPMARLEVLGDDLRDIQVDSRGAIQSDSPRFLSVSLGAIDRLSMSWPRMANRVTDVSQVQVFSDTWLHFHPDNVIAMCQLRITGASALPETLRIVGDSNWQPIGTDWHGAKMLRSDASNVGPRPIYIVAREYDGRDSLTIRAMFLPRDSQVSSLSLPFLSLQESAPLARTLAISNVGRPSWKRLGTENWQTMLSSQISNFWVGERLAEQPIFLRVPSGLVTASLQKLPSPPKSEAEEVTEVSLEAPLSRIRYSAHWSDPLVGKPIVRLKIPADAHIASLLVDGLPARYRVRPNPSVVNADETNPSGVSESPTVAATDDELVVMIDAARGGAQTLDLQLMMTNELGKAKALPRVLLEDVHVSSSIYQLLRGAEFQCALKQNDADAIAFEPVSIRPTAQLLNLQTPIGQANLGERFRTSTELPVMATLTSSESARRGNAVLILRRDDQGWRAQLEAQLEGSGNPADFLFLDVPSSLVSNIRESIETNHPLMIWPSADSSRSILCVMPNVDAAGRTRVSMGIRLAASASSQSITIPDVRILSADGGRPLVALPNEINGVPIRWTQGGRILPNDHLARQGMDELDLSDSSLFELGLGKNQAVWQPRQEEDKTVRVFLTQLHIAGQSKREGVMQWTYWIEPRNQIYIRFSLPSSCKLIGAELAGQAVTPLTEKSGEYRILLRPSTLPARLTLHLSNAFRPNREDGERRIRVDAPRLEAVLDGPLMVASALPSGYEVAIQNGPMQELDLVAAEGRVAAVWSDAITQAMPIAADRSIDEISQWLAAWSPEAVGLPEELSLRGEAAPAPESLSADDGTSETVKNYWEGVLSRLGAGMATTTAVSHVSDRLFDGKVRWYWFSPLGSESLPTTVEIVKPRPLVSQVVEQVLPALLVGIAVFVLSIWLARSAWSQQRIALFAERLWPAWIGLTAVVLVISPVWWTKAIVIVCLLTVFVRYLRSLRQERRTTAFPYNYR